MLKIGTLVLKHGIVLAPMAGVSDLPFRLLCREQGCELAVTEMVSAKAVYYKNRGTAELLRTEPSDRPLAIQLFGSDPAICAEVAEQLEEGPWEIIDFNMGCPVPKVVNNGEGSRLMTMPKLAGEIIQAMVKRVRKPVTVKIRSGFDREHVNAPEFAKVLEQAGAAAITVHGRTREDYYSGRADRSVIRAVKEAVSVPVIGNGDITSGEEARSMLEETGCDGIMIARGAEGNPWIFSEIRWALEGKQGVQPRVMAHEKRDLILRHMEMQIQQDGAQRGIRKMRSHLASYLHGLPNAAQIRNSVNTAESEAEMREIVCKAFGSVDTPQII
ncbi:tRNA dihydrouridine synthase DusB [Lachnospiraceae bacterium]|nr:tRNA dihydrouridine synthase DusB [Lachnospiraceae bacterium]